MKRRLEIDHGDILFTIIDGEPRPVAMTRVVHETCRSHIRMQDADGKMYDRVYYMNDITSLFDKYSDAKYITDRHKTETRKKITDRINGLDENIAKMTKERAGLMVELEKIYSK